MFQGNSTAQRTSSPAIRHSSLIAASSTAAVARYRPCMSFHFSRKKVWFPQFGFKIRRAGYTVNDVDFTVCNFRVCNYATLTDAHAAENVVRLRVEQVEVVRVVGTLDLQLLNTTDQTNTNANR